MDDLVAQQAGGTRGRWSSRAESGQAPPGDWQGREIDAPVQAAEELQVIGDLLRQAMQRRPECLPLQPSRAQRLVSEALLSKPGSHPDDLPSLRDRVTRRLRRMLTAQWRDLPTVWEEHKREA